MNSLAVLLTCFNRKEKTIRCLQKLFDLDLSVSVYLVDDGSTDGTDDAVRSAFPQVTLIKGNGDLFWNRGMHLAWEEAAKKNYDYYLWLNDDVLLRKNCFEELFACAALTHHKAIISGLIADWDEEKIIYGGYDANKKLIQENGKLNPITYMNGNVVLVPKKVFAVLGNLDPYFHHDLGDVDYGLRAKQNNIAVVTTRKALAFGEVNTLCRERLNNTTILKRFKKLYSPLGSNPKINFYFRKRHQGYAKAMLYFLFQHILNIVPDKLNTKIFGTKYK